MYYAYFRFYVSESQIEAGLEEYCTGWEHMAAIGYNYLEYKCYVDNLGGFEHWVGDMSGYISPTRETGFTDGSPSDSMYDATLLMGQSKIDLPDLRYLHTYKPPLDIIVRKINAIATDNATLKYTFGSNTSLVHSFFGAYDSSKIEKFNYAGEINNLSTDVTSSDLSVDLSIASTDLSIDPSSTASNPENSINGNFDNYATLTNGENIYYDLDGIKDIYNVCYKYYLVAGGGSATYLTLYYGDSLGGAWTQIDDDHIGHDGNKTAHKYTFRDLDVSGRFLKMHCEVAGSHNGHMKLYNLLCGVA